MPVRRRDEPQRDPQGVGDALLQRRRVEPVGVDAGDDGARRHPGQRGLDPAPATAASYDAGAALTKFLAPALIAFGSWHLVPKVFSAILFITSLLFWFLTTEKKEHSGHGCC